MPYTGTPGTVVDTQKSLPSRPHTPELGDTQVDCHTGRLLVKTVNKILQEQY